jgi:endonuclease III
MMLPVSKFKWKFENPQNAPCKKIANEAGFEALVDVVMAKQTTDNVVVWL